MNPIQEKRDRRSVTDPSREPHPDLREERNPYTANPFRNVPNSRQIRMLESGGSPLSGSRLANQTSLSNSAVNNYLSNPSTVYQFEPEVIRAGSDNETDSAREPDNGAFAPVPGASAGASDAERRRAALQNPADPTQTDTQTGVMTGEAAARAGALNRRERQLARFAGELTAPGETAGPPPLPPFMVTAPLLFISPPSPDTFQTSPRPDLEGPTATTVAGVSDAALSDVKKRAAYNYRSVVQLAREKHDRMQLKGNIAIQSAVNAYLTGTFRLSNNFLQADNEIEMAFRASLGKVRESAIAADQLIVGNYAQARAALANAVSNSKKAIKANADSAQTQITTIINDLARDFVDPLQDAKRECREASDTSQTHLVGWKTGIARRYPDEGDSNKQVTNEAVRLTAPKLADDTLGDLREATTAIVRRFDANITQVRTDIRARVGPSLEAHANQIETRGNDSINRAFGQAFTTLKRQAEQARQANAETHKNTVEQLLSLRRAERERLEQEAEQVMNAAHDEMAAATTTLSKVTAQALPHYSDAVDQLHDTLSQASEKGPASLDNVSRLGAPKVAAAIGQAGDLQQRQIDTVKAGAEQGLLRREDGTRQQMTEIVASAGQYFDESADSAISAMVATAEAMTRGFSTAADGVTAAARAWIRPLSEAFSEFLTATRDELTRGKPAFDNRVSTAKSDFLTSARRQGNPDELFKTPLINAQAAALSKVITAKLNLAQSLDAGIFNRIDEAGVGNALRGLTAIQGNAVRAAWPKDWQAPYTDPMMRSMYIQVTGSRVYTLDGHLLVDLGPGSSDYNAAINYLNGNTAAGARYELEASLHWYNDEESRIERIMRDLTSEQLQELHRLDNAEETTASKVHDALDGTDLNVFDALDQGNHAAADAYRMRDRLNAARERDDADAANEVLAEYSGAAVYGGEPIGAAERRAAVQLEFARIQGIDLAAQAAEMNRQREAAAAEAREEESGTEPVPEPAPGAETEGPAPEPSPAAETESPAPAEAPTIASRWMSGLAMAHAESQPEHVTEAQAAAQTLFEYATRDIQQVRYAGEGETYTVTLSVTGRNRDLARAIIFHGADSPEANAARLGVEVERRGGPNIVNIDKALVDERLNPDLQVDDPVAREQIRQRALDDRRRMMEIFARDYGDWRPESGIDPADVLAGRLENAFGSDTAGGELAALLVRDEHPTPETAARAMQYAVEGAGTNNELIDRTLGRMNREDIQTMREAYHGNTNRDLYDDLGVFGHGLFGDLSGDDRLRAERMLLGRPRNDRERAEVAAFTIQQQREETGWVGKMLASGSLQETMLDQEEAALKSLTGGQITFGTEGQPHWSDRSAFNADNEFMGNVPLLRATTEGAQLAARNYSAKIDQYANAAAMGIAVLGAIAAAVATVVTGGAASPLLMAAIAGITGLTAMGAQAMIKGGRYGWEQAATDLGMTAVQMLTAGVGQSLALASRGGAAGLQAGMKAKGVLGTMGRLSGNAFLDKVLIGMATGGLGSLGQAAISEETWAKGGEAGAGNLFAATFRGMLSGGVTSGVSNAIEDMPLTGRLSGLSRLLGSDTIGDAIGSSTNVLGRGLGKGVTSGLGAFAGRGTELAYESERGTYAGDAGDIFESMAQAGATSFLQSAAEGGAEARAQAIYNARYAPGRAIPERVAPEEIETADRIPLTEELPGGPAVGRRIEGPSEPRPVEAPELVKPAMDREGAMPTAPRPADETGPTVVSRMAEEIESSMGHGGAKMMEPTRPLHEQDLEASGLRPQKAVSEPTAGDENLEATTRRALSEFEGRVGTAAAEAKEGAAAAIAGSEMRLAPGEELKATPAELHQAATEAVSRVTALAGARVDTAEGGAGLNLEMTRADGNKLRVRVVFGETEAGDVASFRSAGPEDEADFIVTISKKAHPEIHARAIAHELAELRVHGLEGHSGPRDLLTTQKPLTDDARLSAHDVGRLAELELLTAQLGDARAAGAVADDPVTTRLQTEIETLNAHLGLLHSDETDPRLLSALKALGEDSPAGTELMNARRRAAEDSLGDALHPARRNDETTRLSAADRRRIAELDELAARAEWARRMQDHKGARRLEQDAEDLMARMGLLGPDSAADRRVEMAEGVLDPDGAGGRFLKKARQTPSPRFEDLNDALRPGLKPDAQTALSENDTRRIEILKAALENLASLEAEGGHPARIARLRHEAEDQAAAMGLVHGGESAEARSALAKSQLGGPDTRLAEQLDTVRQSALQSAFLVPRRGTIEDLPLLARQIDEARNMGDHHKVAELTEIAALRMEQAGVLHSDPDVQVAARKNIDRIVADNPAARALADEALARHTKALIAKSLRAEAESVRASLDQLHQDIAEAQDAALPQKGRDRPARRRYAEQLRGDAEILEQHLRRLEARAIEAEKAAGAERGLNQVESTELRSAARLRSDPDFPGNRRQQELVRRMFADSPEFQSWERFKERYLELNPSVKATTIRDDVPLDAAELERLFGYWMSGKYVNESAPRGRFLPDQPVIHAGPGEEVPFIEPGTAEPVRLASSAEVQVDGRTMTADEAEAQRRQLMVDRDVLTARREASTDPAERSRLDDDIKGFAKDINDLSEALGEAAGLRFAETLPGGAAAAVVDRGHGVPDIIHIDPVTGRVTVIECKGGTSELGVRRATVGGRPVMAEQTTPEYLRSLADFMMRPGASKQSIKLGAKIIEALNKVPPHIDAFVVRQPFDSNGRRGPVEVTKHPVTRSGN